MKATAQVDAISGKVFAVVSPCVTTDAPEGTTFIHFDTAKSLDPLPKWPVDIPKAALIDPATGEAPVAPKPV